MRPEELHARDPIFGSDWMHAMASYNFKTGCIICGWYPVIIHPESKICSLGNTKMGHCVSQVNKGPMAYLWWEEQESC